MVTGRGGRRCGGAEYRNMLMRGGGAPQARGGAAANNKCERAPTLARMRTVGVHAQALVGAEQLPLRRERRERLLVAVQRQRRRRQPGVLRVVVCFGVDRAAASLVARRGGRWRRGQPKEKRGGNSKGVPPPTLLSGENIRAHKTSARKPSPAWRRAHCPG